MAREQLPTNVVPLHYEIFVTPDAAALSFTGKVTITIRVEQETNEIVLNAHPDLVLSGAALTKPRQEKVKIAPDGQKQRVTLKLAQPVKPPEEPVIEIDYKGKINKAAQGLFVSPYDTRDGPEQILLTQFEMIGARRFMPCWDEPALKATFTLSAVVAKTEVAISNMPIADRVEVDPARDRVCFKPTPKMSTYLLFLGIGKLERLERRVGGTTLGVVTRQGSACKGRFALDSAAQLLLYYNDYFRLPYPLPKLDLIAAPGAGGFSAMQNWGAILYFETELLVDPDVVPKSARQRVFSVIAHEMAHQWFGNLVTMAWWDDLWLNEGFATWMQNKAEEQLHPEWQAWFDAEAERQRAMRQDAMPTAHAIVHPVDTPQQAAFDDITYRKGAAVIRMIESYVGAEGFRKGVREYLGEHENGNATTADLWRAVEAKTGKDLKDIADDFTRRPHFPLITLATAETANGQTTLALEQRAFAIGVCANATSTRQRLWSTPVTVSSVTSPSGSETRLFKHAPSFADRISALPPIQINSGQTGYYRCRYAAGSLALLTANFAALFPVDQVGLLQDLWTLAEAGDAPIADYLELVRRIPCEAPPPVWRQVIRTLLFLDGLSRGLPLAASLRAFGRVLLTPLLDRIGWDAKPGEEDKIKLLREELVEALGRFEARPVIEDARSRVTGLLRGWKIPGATRAAFLRVAAECADETLYLDLLGAARRETDALAAPQLWAALASARDGRLAGRSLEIALDIEPPTLGPVMIKQVGRDNPDLAWRFALAHLKEIRARLDAMGDPLIPSLAAQSNDPERLPELRRYLDDDVPDGSRQLLEMFYCELQFRLKVRGERLPEIERWLGGAMIAP